jgi:hypothetical protein
LHRMRLDDKAVVLAWPFATLPLLQYAGQPTFDWLIPQLHDVPLEPVRNFLESAESVVILCPRARRFAGGHHVDDEEPRSVRAQGIAV